MRKTVTIRVSAFALEALAGDDQGGPGRLPETMVRAIRCYLSDRDSGRTGWAFPPFLRNRESGGVTLELKIDEDLWRAFEAEAARQKVSTQQLAGHAAFYFAAEVDAGRIAERILDDLGGTEG
jgi:hypothetical protein